MFGMAWLNINCVVYTRFTLEILRRSFKDCDTHSLEQLKLRHKKLMWLLTGRGHGHRQQSFQDLSPNLKATRTDTPNWVARRAGLWLSCFSSGQLCVAFSAVTSSNTADDDQSFLLETQEGPGSNMKMIDPLFDAKFSRTCKPLLLSKRLCCLLDYEV